MRGQSNPARPRRRLRFAALGLVAALALSGCGAELARGFLPKPVTKQAEEVVGFWNALWIAALAVGLLVWGLTLWCIVAYRRKKNDHELPPQVRYNVPLEILYTIVPVLMVAVIFGKTVEVQNDLLDTAAKPDVIVNVAAKRWSWDFNYVREDVHITGTQAVTLDDGKEGVPDTLPTMVLPVDSQVEFVLTSRDVIHSFWVPQFIMKMDVLPGRVNIFQVSTTEEGMFMGKCAELCGAYHSQMLFRVHVVSKAEYEKSIEGMRAAGDTGQLDNGLNLYRFEEGQLDKLPPEMRN